MRRERDFCTCFIQDNSKGFYLWWWSIYFLKTWIDNCISQQKYTQLKEIYQVGIMSAQSDSWIKMMNWWRVSKDLTTTDHTLKNGKHEAWHQSKDLCDEEGQVDDWIWTPVKQTSREKIAQQPKSSKKRTLTHVQCSHTNQLKIQWPNSRAKQLILLFLMKRSLSCVGHTLCNTPCYGSPNYHN
jgi:hypothetical protein